MTLRLAILSLGSNGEYPVTIQNGKCPVAVAQEWRRRFPGTMGGLLVDLTAASRGPYRTGLIRRRQIIEAATAAIGRRGYAGASLRVIAEAAGVTTAGLLRHFNSKQELLMAVLDQWTLDTDELFDGRTEGLDWFLQFPGLMRYHEEHPGLIELYLTLCGEASDPDHPARQWLTNHYDRTIAIAIGHLRVARDAGTVEAMPDRQLEQEVRALYALMDGLELQWISHRELDLAEIFSSLLASTVARWRCRLR
jgi:AcrR family transcriptional regulator